MQNIEVVLLLIEFSIRKILPENFVKYILGSKIIIMGGSHRPDFTNSLSILLL